MEALERHDKIEAAIKSLIPSAEIVEIRQFAEQKCYGIALKIESEEVDIFFTLNIPAPLTKELVKSYLDKTEELFKAKFHVH